LTKLERRPQERKEKVEDNLKQKQKTEDDLASQVVKESLPSGRKDKSIMEMFRSQEKKNMEERITTLETEERMERKRRMETSWREKRNHYDLLRWAK
jgi:surfactin synthase thioesterase subunit